LFALAEACGRDCFESSEKGLRWLANPPEIPGALIDMERNVIWHKVARHEPGRLVRRLQTTGSLLHLAIRVLTVDSIFPSGPIDCESWPYHMGWILHAFSSDSHLRL